MANGFKFYKILKDNFPVPPIYKNFDIEQDFQRQKINYKSVKLTKSDEVLEIRNRHNSLTEKMLLFNGVEKIETTTEALEENNGLRLVDNSQFNFCETYSKKFLIPRIVSNSILSDICKFRVKGRIPIVCYIYSPSNSKG